MGRGPAKEGGIFKVTKDRPQKQTAMIFSWQKWKSTIFHWPKGNNKV